MAVLGTKWWPYRHDPAAAVHKLKACIAKAKKRVHASVPAAAPQAYGDGANKGAAAALRAALRGKRPRKRQRISATTAAPPHPVATSTSKALLPSPLSVCRCVPTVIFLGTGAAAPSKLRNCSGILVMFPTVADPFRCILVDAGEGTLGQIRSYFGNQGADKVHNHTLSWQNTIERCVAV